MSLSFIPLQTQKCDPRRRLREGGRQECRKGHFLTPRPPLSERPSLNIPPSHLWPRSSPCYTYIPRALSTLPSQYLSQLQSFTCITGCSVGPPRVWALQGQRSSLSCLLLYPLTPGPGLWMLHKYLPTDSLRWSGQSWDLDPGISNFQGSLETQSPG